MNPYGRLAHDNARRHRPQAYGQILDPERFIRQVGGDIQPQVNARRVEILGPPRPGEDPEVYCLRSYQALTTAEELTLTDLPLLQPDPAPDPDPREETDDPDLERPCRHPLTFSSG